MAGHLRIAHARVLGSGQRFMQTLALASGLAAKKLALAKLRPQLEPRLEKKGLDWKTFEPVLNAVTIGLVYEFTMTRLHDFTVKENGMSSR